MPSENYHNVCDIPDDWQLVSDSQDIRATLDSIGKPEEAHETGCLFVKVGDGEYLGVYQCSRSVPWLGARDLATPLAPSDSARWSAGAQHGEH